MRDPASNDTFLVTNGAAVPAAVLPPDVLTVYVANATEVSGPPPGQGPPPGTAPGTPTGTGAGPGPGTGTPMGPGMGGGPGPENTTSPVPAFPQLEAHAAVYRRLPLSQVGAIAFYRPTELMAWGLFEPSSSSNQSAWSTTFQPAFRPAAFFSPPAPVFRPGPNASISYNNADALAECVASRQCSQGQGQSKRQDSAPGPGAPIVFVQHDGVLVVGATLVETVWRFVQAQKNALILARAATLAAAAPQPEAVQPQFVQGGTGLPHGNYTKDWVYWLQEIEDKLGSDRESASAQPGPLPSPTSAFPPIQVGPTSSSTVTEESATPPPPPPPSPTESGPPPAETTQPPPPPPTETPPPPSPPPSPGPAETATVTTTAP